MHSGSPARAASDRAHACHGTAGCSKDETTHERPASRVTRPSIAEAKLDAQIDETVTFAPAAWSPAATCTKRIGGYATPLVVLHDGSRFVPITFGRGIMSGFESTVAKSPAAAAASVSGGIPTIAEKTRFAGARRSPSRPST